MRINKSLIKMVSIPLAVAALAACSGKSADAPAMIDSNGKHPGNWIGQHWAAYEQANGGKKTISANTSCSECHGSDLSGGISKVSCFSASMNGMSCHPDRVFGHPADWANPLKSGFHGLSFNSNLDSTGLGNAINTSCAPCHSTDSAADKVAGSPSCLSSDPKWAISCHSGNPKNGCSSCHGLPPSGAVGSAAPNRAGAHAAHLALNGVTCSTCHVSYGPGSQQHATARFTNHSTAYVKLTSLYYAESGTYNFIGGKCSAISCHGGQTTPDWNTGTINVGSDCVKCHQQQDPMNPQYNSFYSGNYQTVNLHQYHLALTGVVCTDCHNPVKMGNSYHFAALNTPAFEFPASYTLGGNNTKVSNYDVSTGSCTNTCHTQAPNPAHWY
jgi:predicted CxxxxCH...CXXCH cytochrome family protein